MFFFTGVAFTGVEVAALVAGLAVDLGGFAVVFVGVGPVPVGTVLAGLETPVVAPAALSFLGTLLTGVEAVPVVLETAGVTLVTAVPVVIAGFEALLTAVFPVDVVEAAVFFKGVTTDFVGVAVVTDFVGVAVVAGFVSVAVVAGFVSVAVVAAGFVSPATAGVLRTGSFFCVPNGVLGLGVAVLVAFFTGGMGVVFDAAEVVALAGVEVTDFLVAGVLLAVLATLFTLARWLCYHCGPRSRSATYIATRPSAS